MTESVAVRIDLSSGRLEVESPHDQLASVFKHVSEVLPVLREASIASTVSGTAEPEITVADEERPAPEKQRPRRRVRGRSRSASESTGGRKLGAAFYKDFEPIDLGLGDKNEIELKQFYDGKKPKTTDEKALVAAVFLSKALARNLTYDDLYQGLRLAGEPRPPANMSAAVGSLAERNYVVKEEDGIRVKVQGSDYVEREMPQKIET